MTSYQTWRLQHYLMMFLFSSIYLRPTKKDKIITTFYIDYKNIIYHLNIESPKTRIGISYCLFTCLYEVNRDETENKEHMEYRCSGASNHGFKVCFIDFKLRSYEIIKLNLLIP